MGTIETAEAHEIHYDKMNDAVLNASLVKYKLSSNGTRPQRVYRLAVELAKKLAGTKDMATCDVCGCDSDINESACPYCGVGGIVEEPPAKAKPRTSAMPPAKANGKANGHATNGHAMNGHATNGLAKVHAQAHVDESKLDATLAEIRAIKARTMRGFLEAQWDLGHKLFEVYEGSLHETRRNPDGSQKYKNWSSFCTHEVQLSVTHCYRLMDVSQHFSREQVAEIGSNKLHALLRLPEDVRAEILKKVKITSKTKLDEEIHRLAGPTKRDEGGRGKGRGRPPKAKLGELNAGKITVAIANELEKLPMLARSKSEGKPAMQATKLSQEPRAVWKLTNNVEVHFIVHQDAKGLIWATIEPRRLGE